MAKLADIDSEIRTLGKVAAVGIVALVLLFIVIMGGQFIKNVFFPTPPPPPTEKFGKIPPPVFNAQEPQTLSYTVNTLTGSLPNLPTRMNVYKTKTQQESLVALSNARTNLTNGGYTDNETKINESVYQWTNSINKTNIQYNITNENFDLTSDLTSSPPTNFTGAAGEKAGAFDTINTFLQSIGEDTSDLNPDTITLTFLKVQDGQLVAASSQNSAQYVRVDLFQKDLDRLKIYYPKLTESPMYFILSSQDSNAQIVYGSFANMIPDTTQVSDYYTINIDQAYEQLKKGNAAIFNTSNSENIQIADVSMGYYISPDQKYFIPIVIFSGNNFKAYVDVLAQ
jgi:hypothetical protein